MIYLIRHGLDNEEYIGGWSNGDLIEQGIKQIEESTNYIVNNNLIINSIISSDIKRAITTTNIINKKLNVKVIYTSNLRELNKGNLNRKLKSETDIMYYDFLKNLSINSKYPNGESMQMLYDRIIQYLKILNNIDNTLLVTHSGVINMIYYYLNNIKLDMSKEQFNVTHGSIHELDLNKKLIRRIH